MTTRLNIAIIATAVLAILAQVMLFGGLSSALPAGLMPFATIGFPILWLGMVIYGAARKRPNTWLVAALTAPPMIFTTLLFVIVYRCFAAGSCPF